MPAKQNQRNANKKAAAVAEPAVVDTQVKAQTKRKNPPTAKKTAVAAPVAEPVVEAVATAPVARKRSNSRARKVEEPVVEAAAPVVEAVAETAPVARKRSNSRTRKVEEPVVEAAPATTTAVETEAEDEEKKKRCFHVINAATGEPTGRYTGADHGRAACGAFSQLKKRANKNGEDIPKEAVIYMRESTQRSGKGFFACRVRSIDLAKPHQRPVFNKKTKKQDMIVYTCRNKPEDIEVPEDIKNRANKWNLDNRERKKAEAEAVAAPVAEPEPVKVVAKPNRNAGKGKGAKINR